MPNNSGIFTFPGTIMIFVTIFIFLFLLLDFLLKNQNEQQGMAFPVIYYMNFMNYI